MRKKKHKLRTKTNQNEGLKVISMTVTHFETKERSFLVFCDTNIFSWVMIYYNFKRSLMTFMTFFLHTVVSIKK